MSTVTASPEATRRAWLLTEIRTRGGVWTAHRAATALHRSPWPSTGRNTARKDLRALAARGALAARDDLELRRRSYTPKSLLPHRRCPKCRATFEACNCRGAV
ncbi:hypothetical protein [Streptomyces sp. NPDC094049]|uniref:hypothetical protein n=1 Tax=Streptomyces sp. NPDC094049 TaxID=3154987 RepID=UPI003333033E